MTKQEIVDKLVDCIEKGDFNKISEEEKEEMLDFMNLIKLMCIF